MCNGIKKGLPTFENKRASATLAAFDIEQVF
jgi:hypothetical protein